MLPRAIPTSCALAVLELLQTEHYENPSGGLLSLLQCWRGGSPEEVPLPCAFGQCPCSSLRQATRLMAHLSEVLLSAGDQEQEWKREKREREIA